MDPTPRISVVVPVYNRTSLLGQTVESVKGQTLDSWELIVVDDGSTEDVRGAMTPYLSDRRVSYRRQANGERCVARNNGAAAASGELLCFLDSDDRYASDALESLLAAFESDADLGMALGGYDLIDGKGVVTGTVRPWEQGAPDVGWWLFEAHAIPASTMIARRWFEQVAGFEPGFEGVEDRDLFLRLALAGCPTAWVRRSVCQHRRYEGNTSSRTQRDAALRMFDRAFQDPRCPPELRGREKEARAGRYLYTARKAAESGDNTFVRENLEEVARLAAEPPWRREGMLLAPAGFAAEIQWLVHDAAERCDGAAGAIEAELSRLAAAWAVPLRELRRALAQRHARTFFAYAAHGDFQAAAEHRKAALRLDPRWYVHRSILLFPLRRLLRTWRSRPA